MESGKTNTSFSAEVRERAVRLVREHQGDYSSEWAAISSIAAKIGCTAESLRRWIRQTERDEGRREGLTTDERARLKALERENRELRQGCGDQPRNPSASEEKAKMGGCAVQSPFSREIWSPDGLPCQNGATIASPVSPQNGLCPAFRRKGGPRAVGKIGCGRSIDHDTCANGTIFAIVKLRCEIGCSISVTSPFLRFFCCQNPALRRANNGRAQKYGCKRGWRPPPQSESV